MVIYVLHNTQLIIMTMEHRVQLVFYSFVMMEYGVQCVVKVFVRKILQYSVISWDISVSF